MSVKFDCDNNEALVSYLYDESDPAERAAVAAHLAICTRCAEEIAGLRDTRVQLAEWAPPEAQLGFRIVSDVAAEDVAAGVSRKDVSRTDNVLRPARWWQQPLPAWAQAAAAVLIFAAGAGLGALRSGTAVPPASTTAASTTTASTTSATTANAPAVSSQDLVALEQRLRAEMQQSQPVSVPVSVTASHDVPAAAGALSMQQVRALIAESEQRQKHELDLRTTEVVRDIDTQRRGDLARIEQTFGRMEGTTGEQVEQQRQMINYLMRVSQQK